MNAHPVVFVLGPTGSGKSSLAHQLALRTGGVILNCDSVQAYKHVDIGTAKPSTKEREEVPHLLFDYIEPPQELTAGRFREAAREQIEKHIEWGAVFAVGGSGFYIKALQSKMYELKDVTPSALQRIYEMETEQGPEALYREMIRLDSELKGQIAPQDSYRIKRALGLMWTYEKTLTEIRNQTQAAQSPQDWPYKTLKLGLEISRQELRKRVTLRRDEMLRQGWREEVDALLKRGLQNWAPMRSVGYKELVACHKGEISFEEAKERIVISTMQLAKRQMTWFRKDPEIHWVPASISVEEVLKGPCSFLQLSMS